MKSKTNNMDTDTRIAVTPKEVIFFYLGGYTGEANGEPVSLNTEKVCDGLIKYLEKSSSAIAVIDGKLEFVKMEIQ